MFWKKKKKLKAQELNFQNFNQEIEKKKLSFVFFEASWCHACKMLHPIINELAEENKQKDILISFVDVDYERELSQEYSIMSLPTFVVFNNKEVVYQGTGMISKPRLQEMIDDYLA